MIREIIMKQWIIILIKRFKERDDIALKILQEKKLIIVNARFERTSRVYVQNIIKHVKSIEFFFIYN